MAEQALGCRPPLSEPRYSKHRLPALRALPERVEGAGRFGVLAAGLNARLRSKGGWRAEDDGGCTVNQAAQVTIADQTYGFAMLLGRQQTFETGGARIAAVARAAFTTTATLPGDCAGGVMLAGETGQRIGQIARRYLGRNARRRLSGVRDAVELDIVEQLNRRLALELGADARCSDPSRILRPVGSANWKSGRPVAVRLLRLDGEQSVDVCELDRQLPAQPVERRRLPRAAAGEDPLLELSPRVYVERLTGQRVGRRGKVRCPFHEDRTPSRTCMTIRDAAGFVLDVGLAARSMTSPGCCWAGAHAARTSSTCVAS